MRTMILVLAVLLAGCGSSDDDSALATKQQVSAIPNESTAVASLRAEVLTLQGQVNKLRLIGKPSGTSAITSALIPGGGLLPNATSFGTCPDMGVLIGFTNGNGIPANALSALAQDFRQCTGYQYEALVASGSIGTPDRMFWDGPNCTGNIIEWEAGGAGYDTSSLTNGVVFTSLVDSSVLMVRAGQTPQPILIQSVLTKQNLLCQSDVETQLMYRAEPNDVSVSGVPDAGVGKFQLGAP